MTAGPGGAADVLARVARALAARPGARARVAPGDPPPRRAAVALALRAGPDGAAELLFIKRAEYPGDPWSGHVAFPGGRCEPGDLDLWHTAARETREETGLDLLAHGRLLGTLDEIYPRTPMLPPVVVRPYVAAVGAAVAAAAPLALSDEVAAAFWVPLAHFAGPGVCAERTVEGRGGSVEAPSYAYAGHTIWGMTERILRQFLGLLAGSNDGPGNTAAGAATRAVTPDTPGASA